MTARRVTMVHCVTDAAASSSHGLASLAGALLAARPKEVDLRLITVRDRDMERAAQEILAGEPAIVLVSAKSHQWGRVRAIAEHVKRASPATPLVVGGSHVIADPASVEASAFDAGFASEGESAVAAIVLGGPLDPPSVAERVRQEALRTTLLSDLDLLPLPALEIFTRDDVLEYPSVMFSRGCPYRCSYCMSRAGGLGGQVRWKSPARAIREVRDLVSFARPDQVNIDDDTLLKRPVWVREFCRLYREEIDVPFFCNARPETLSEELARCLREAGCQAVGIGIESGSERLRREVLDRRMSDEAILRAFACAHAAGLETWSFNMVGLPGERAEDLEATIALNERAQTEFVRVSIFTPYPGTPLFARAAAPLDDDGVYYRGLAHLPPELAQLYVAWVRRLHREGRVWLTDAEAREAGLDPS